MESFPPGLAGFWCFQTFETINLPNNNSRSRRSVGKKWVIKENTVEIKVKIVRNVKRVRKSK